MAYLRSLLALAALWMISGCEINRVLIIKPDGSGQITDHYLASLDTFEKEKKAGEKPEPGVLEIRQPRPTAESVGKAAAKFGEGIKVKSFKMIQTKEMLGYDAVYEFADVTKLHADAFLQQMEGPGQAVPPEGGSRNFQFTKGPVSELVIAMKEIQGDKKESPAEAAPPNDDPKQREAFVEAIKHLHMRFAIRVVGKIEETNSHFRKDNEVVLSEMNMKGMAADPKYAQMFKDAASGKTDPKEPPEDERYIKHETVDALKIRFK